MSNLIITRSISSYNVLFKTSIDWLIGRSRKKGLNNPKTLLIVSLTAAVSRLAVMKFKMNEILLIPGLISNRFQLKYPILSRSFRYMYLRPIPNNHNKWVNIKFHASMIHLKCKFNLDRFLLPTRPFELQSIHPSILRYGKLIASK